MTEKDISNLTRLQRVKLKGQIERIEKLWSFVHDYQETGKLCPNWSDSTELYDELFDAMTFYSGMVFALSSDYVDDSHIMLERIELD